MNVSDLFIKDIQRQINGVVKAGQLDEESIWQELDEFVVTTELDQHVRLFFDRYGESLSARGSGASETNGVWISGFFGSGKSHFIKILSHLIENREHNYRGDTKHAVEFFEDKIKDATVLGDIKKAVESATDVLLFNIDDKASSADGENAVLAVFLRMLNQRAGYSPDHAHIAHMERNLDKQGKLEVFTSEFERLTGKSWLSDRDAYEFTRDEVIQALMVATSQSEESCAVLIDNSDNNFSLTVENFANWVLEFIDKDDDNRRIIFLVDEVGQFIGGDSRLMLKLQTITEQLGTVCNGRAWVVVTSQEDVYAVLGGMDRNDPGFSKIQGRFHTRMSLSGSNVDEVLKERLLKKNDDAVRELTQVFAENGDIIRNQLSFRDIGTTYKEFAESNDFVETYPFIPYQFRLLQRIFESIRKAGATGVHLSQAERSLLDAFQSAAKSICDNGVGVLAPLYLFYPSIQSFLDTSVKRTIDQARENDGLEDFDINVLQVLFLIRYVDEMQANIDNLVTLCVDQIDTDRLSLKKTIGGSLVRLEANSLVSRNGDIYQFLTNEERDISREIKKILIAPGDQIKLLSSIIFRDALRDNRKHKFTLTKKDIPFIRVCDGHPVDHSGTGELTFSIITPLDDNYSTASDQKCILDSSTDGGRILVRLDDNNSLGAELESYLKTDKYIKTKDSSILPTTTQKILKELALDNQNRRTALANMLEQLLVDGQYFVAGEKLVTKSTTGISLMADALEYLIENTFTKLSYLQHLTENPLKEISAILKSDDTAQLSLEIEKPEYNPRAVDDIREYIRLKSSVDQQIILYDTCFGRYSDRPFGWPEWETALCITRLYNSSELIFLQAGEKVRSENVYSCLSETKNWKKITIKPRISTDGAIVSNARELGNSIFHQMGPDSEDKLFEFLANSLESWKSSLTGNLLVADNTDYPGADLIKTCLTAIKPLLSVVDTNQFLERFVESQSDMEQLSTDYHILDSFYTTQKQMWDKMLRQSSGFTANKTQLSTNNEANEALEQIDAIRSNPAPYSDVAKLSGLLATVKHANDALIKDHRQTTDEIVNREIALTESELSKVSADDTLTGSCVSPLKQLLSAITKEDSIPHLIQMGESAVQLKDHALAAIDRFVNAEVTDGNGPGPGTVFKKPKIVEPSKLVENGYIETAEDVIEFIDKLKAVLDKAIEADERVDIR
jgi:hypothetical protein